MADSKSNLKSFYEKLSRREMAALERRSGLTACKDLERLRPDFDRLPTGAILEIGAGQGRVLRWLRKHYPQFTLHAIEHHSENIDLLRKEFGKYKNVTVFAQSLHGWTPAPAYDVALWMWCSFNEQSPEEQQSALETLRKSLRPGGLVVIDVPRWNPDYADVWYPQGIPPDGTPKLQPFTYGDGVLQGHYFTDAEMETMARRAGFSNVTSVAHQPTRGLGHVMYRLQA